MTRHDDRMPIWKIAVVAIVCAVVAVALLTASIYLSSTAGPPSADDDSVDTTLNMSGLLLLLGLMCVAVTLLCVAWLAYRYYLSIPAWKRRKGLPRRR